MALPTSQPLNWLQRFAAWLFRIKTTQPVTIIYGKPEKGVLESAAKQWPQIGQWRPGAHTPAPPPKPNTAKAAKAKTLQRLRDPSPIAFYDWIGTVDDWERIMSEPNWYSISRYSKKKEERDWVFIVYDRIGRTRKLKTRFFHSQAQATKFAMALINIHLSKQGQA
jgi:hypothetical protein